jgi:hypothetical protein
VSFGRSLRDPGVDRARVQSYAPRDSPPASLGFDRNTPTFLPGLFSGLSVALARQATWFSFAEPYENPFNEVFVEPNPMRLHES